MKERIIKSDCYGITVKITKDGNGEESATITSDDLYRVGPGNGEFNSAMAGIEALVLGHAWAGIDITTPDYSMGLTIAFDEFNDEKYPRGKS